MDNPKAQPRQRRAASLFAMSPAPCSTTGLSRPYLWRGRCQFLPSTVFFLASQSPLSHLLVLCCGQSDVEAEQLDFGIDGRGGLARCRGGQGRGISNCMTAAWVQRRTGLVGWTWRNTVAIIVAALGCTRLGVPRRRVAGLHGGAAKDGAPGLRILARTIARAHLGRHGERDSAAAPGPPPMGRRSERTIPEARGSEWQP